MIPLTNLQTVAVEAYFGLSRTLDEVRRDPFAPDAEQRLGAAAQAAHGAASAAGVLELDHAGWMRLVVRHPDYLGEVLRHEMFVADEAACRAALEHLEQAVHAGERETVLRALRVLLTRRGPGGGASC